MFKVIDAYNSALGDVLQKFKNLRAPNDETPMEAAGEATAETAKQ